jgi:hypothetical protein
MGVYTLAALPSCGTPPAGRSGQIAFELQCLTRVADILAFLTCVICSGMYHLWHVTFIAAILACLTA